MHLFFESVWKLHIGEIPEKPREPIHIYRRSQNESPDYYLDLERYEYDVAVIKQNALTVGNPEIFLRDEWGYGKFIHMPDGGNHLIESDHFYFWPGGADILEKIPPVAILTLPEEKKNTMENMTKEQAATRKAIKDCAEWLKFCLSIGWQKEQLDGLQKIWWEHHDEKGNLTASGSVAAPKESRDKLLSLGDKHFIIDEITALREALKELLPIAQWGYDLLVPFDKKGMGREWPAIIERARKLLSK